MKKLDQYVLREMFLPFLIGTGVVVLMFQANIYIALGKNMNLSGVPFKAILQFIYYMTPSFLNMTLPVGTALGASLAMSRLARESELTAMRAAGARVLRVIWPVVVFGVFVALGNFYLAERIMPTSTKHANRLQTQIGYLGFAPEIRPNAMLRLGRYTASLGLVTRKGEDLDIERILLVEQIDLRTTLITADRGEYRDGQWTFFNAYLRVLEGQDLVTAKPLDKQFVVNEKIIAADLFNPPVAEELTADQLRESIEAGRRMGSDTKQIEVKWHVRYSVPAACIVFALVAPVFAVIFARSGGFAGVMLSLILVLLYYNAFVISTEIISKMAVVPAWLAAWLPNLLFLVLGVFAIRRLE